MSATEPGYDKAMKCEQCRTREGRNPGDRLPGSIRRGPDEGRLLCGPCWAGTIPSRTRKRRR